MYDNLHRETTRAHLVPRNHMHIILIKRGDMQQTLFDRRQPTECVPATVSEVRERLRLPARQSKRLTYMMEAPHSIVQSADALWLAGYQLLSARNEVFLQQSRPLTGDYPSRTHDRSYLPALPPVITTEIDHICLKFTA